MNFLKRLGLDAGELTLKALALKANTHGVANGGLIASIGAGVIHLAADMVSRGMIHAPLGVGIVLSDLDLLTLPVATGGVTAAYFGRPSTVPAKPTAETMEAIAEAPDATAKVDAIAADAQAKPPVPPAVEAIAHPMASPSSVEADVPLPSRPTVAASPIVAGKTGGRSPMNILQDLQLIEAIAGDAVEFAAGKPVSTVQTIASTSYTAEATLLPSGPTGTPYQVFTGEGFLALLSLAFEDYAAFSAGAPVQIAVKTGNTWVGVSLTAAPAKKAA
ncbi:MAG: hypothetical protein IAI49_14750 [Candidatus Eremiobacteraeota bacterium]|nr:hypothetical protein [Candidatus Eremiobacteraeota bacterium]